LKKGLLEALPKVEGYGWPWTEETSPDVYDSSISYPKISIVTPSYNQGQFIEETIRSILLQNYPNLEYIIIDGGSNDETLEIVEKYKLWITYFISEKDSGQSDAINKGIKKCTGDIFNWLNSDDYYLKNSLHYIATTFDDFQCSMVSGKSRVFGCRNDDHFLNGTPVFSSLKKTISAARIDQPTTFFRMQAVEKMGMLNKDLHYLMDLHWWLRFLMLYDLNDIRKIDDVIVNFREHEESKTVKEEPKFFVDRLLLMSDLQKKIKNKKVPQNNLFYDILIPDHKRKEVILGINDFFLNWLKVFYEKGDKKICKSIIREIDMLKLKKLDPFRLMITKAKLFIMK